MLRTNSVLSSLRGTSNRRMYGASTSQIRFGYEEDVARAQINFLLFFWKLPKFHVTLLSVEL
ncbi:MAG: hypothetical protein EGR83_04615 [Bacteroides cellulosilyticus]|nr:hypothetical protein [Bacteroides cellulosilyticus]